jgi:hypothetical protein
VSNERRAAVAFPVRDRRQQDGGGGVHAGGQPRGDVGLVAQAEQGDQIVGAAPPEAVLRDLDREPGCRDEGDDTNQEPLDTGLVNDDFHWRRFESS